MNAEEEIRVNNGDQYALKWEAERIVALDFSVEDAKKWLEVTFSTTTNKVTLNSVDVSKVKVYSVGTVYAQNDLVFNNDQILKCQIVSDSKEPVKGAEWSVEAPATLLTFKILLANKIDTDLTASFTDTLEIRLPNKRANMKLVFDMGVCSIPVVLNSFENCGTWTIPSSDRVVLNGSEYKVVAITSFEGLLPY